MNLINFSDIYLKKIAVVMDERLTTLNSLQSFSARIKFCNENFKRLTSGSARIIYEYSSEYILKLAKNPKGQAQNRTEADKFLQQHYKNIIANVIDAEPDDKWILVEKATGVSPSQFKSLTGFGLDELCLYLNNIFGPPGKKIVMLYNRPFNETLNVERFENSELIQDLVDMMANFTMPPGDICKKNSWGLVKNRLVLVDYGLTQDIYDEYYRR